uniref:Peptidase A1 domain-containing protein n=1 Tax=Acrobeloides nanus TaxID=290746 RepID=A0A914BUU2_9BILA
MRFIFTLFLIFVLSISATSKVVLPLRHHLGLRNQLIREGKWEQFRDRLERNKLNPREKYTGTVPLYDYFNDFFSHTIQLGTPGQTLIVRADTGSSNLWVMDKNKCKESQCLGFPSLTSNFNRTLFDSNKSSTYSIVNQKFSSDVCLNGTLSSDLLYLPGFGLLTQQFGLCYDVDRFMGLHPFDGYLGLAWPSLAADGATPVVQNLIANGSFTQPVFSVYLANDNTGSITFGRDTAGSITYGGFDTYNCGPNISYVPLSSKTYWQFTLTSFTFGSYSIKKNQQAVVTTGEAIIILPDNVLQTIVTMVNASAASVVDGAKWVVPCNLAPSFPSLTFNIGGNNYVITGTYYTEPVGTLGIYKDHLPRNHELTKMSYFTFMKWHMNKVCRPLVIPTEPNTEQEEDFI